MTCDCIPKVNAALAKAGHNAEIDLVILLPNFIEGPAKVVTRKVDVAKRGKPQTVLASFCPFCGVKYPKEEAA